MPLDSGETLEIGFESLNPGEVLTLDLRFPAPPEGTERLAARVISSDGRVVETSALPRADDRSRASLQIQNDFLAPDRYIIEVKTIEKTHFPLRRYALEVR